MDSRLVEIRHEPPLTPDDEDRLDVLFECNEKLFNVILSDRTLPDFDGPNSIEREYLKRLDGCAWEGDAADEPLDANLQYNIIYGDIENLAQTLYQPIFRERAPAIKDRSPTKEGAMVGILMEYINKTLPNLVATLSKDDIIEKSRRAKWATQIEDTLKQLHAIGVV